MDQIKFWFTMDELRARIEELKRQKARGAMIKPRHLAKIGRMAKDLKDIADSYDTVSR